MTDGEVTSRDRGWLWALHVLALSSLGLAHPLFDVLGRHPTFFVTHRSSWIDIAALVAVVCVVVPGCLLALAVALARLGPRWAEVARAAAVGLAVAPTASIACRGLGLAQAPLALFAGALAALAYARADQARSFATALTPALLVVPALFVGSTAVRQAVTSPPLVEVPPATATRPVIVLVFDALPTRSLVDAGAVDASRFPNFAALAREARWFRNATTVHDYTAEAVPAILTGVRPTGDERAPTVSEHPRSLFTLLGGAWEIVAHEDITALCPPALLSPRVPGVALRSRLSLLLSDAGLAWAHVVLPPAAAAHLPPVDRAWSGFAVDADAQDPRLARAGAFVRGLAAPGPRPGVHFVHLMLPHEPFVLLPSGRRYLAPDGLPGLDPEARWGTWGQDELAVRQAQQRHLLQVQLADRILGEVIAAARSADVWDDAVVVVTADHGECFRPGLNRRLLDRDNAEDLLPVPLFVKVPGHEGGVTDDRNAETIDVLPTIADALGVPIPWAIDGTSLLQPDARRPSKRASRREGSGSVAPLVLPPDFAVAALQDAMRPRGLGGGDLLDDGGPVAGLVGRPLSDFRLVEEEVALALTSSADFEDVALDGPVVPALVTGWSDLDAPLVIAVNGVVRATTRPYRDGSGRFAGLVPEDSFTPGRNEVEVLVLRPDAEGRAHLGRPRAAWRLDGDVLLTPDGATLRPTRGSVAGAVETIERAPDDLLLTGWATRPDARVRAVLAFDGDELLGAVQPHQPRPDVAARLLEAGVDARAGFELRLTGRGRRPPRALRVMAVTAGAAAWLPLSDAESVTGLLDDAARRARLHARCFEVATATVLADATTGWASVDVPQGAQVRAAARGGPLELVGAEPVVRLRPPAAGWPGGPLMVRLVLRSPRAGVVRAAWTSSERGADAAANATWCDAPPGRAVLHLAVWERRLVGPLVLQLRAGQGTYEVETIEARTLEAR